MAAADPDLTLALGDLSYGAVGAEQAWCDRVTSQMGTGYPFELIAGNHESNGQNGNINDFSACLPNQLPGVVGTYGRQWYVDVPQVDPLVRFVMVSPALPFPDSTWSYAAGSPRYNWTAAAIDSARANDIPWVVVGAHKPCYSIGIYTCEIGADFTNMLISKRVDLVLHGHEHMYQRTHQLGLRAGCSTVPAGSVDTDCLADTDGVMSQGFGTVFATSGLGGQEQRTVNNADSEAGYFATASGSNQNPTNGFLDVEVTADDLTAAFVPVQGGTFTDTFTIHRGDAAAQRPADGGVHLVDQQPDRDLRRARIHRPRGPDRLLLVGLRRQHAAGSGAQPSHTYATAGDVRRHADRHRRRRRHRHRDPDGHRHRSPARPSRLRRRQLRPHRHQRPGDGGHRRRLVDHRHRRELRRQQRDRAPSPCPAPARRDRPGSAPPPAPTPTCGSPCRWTRCPPATAPTSTSSAGGSAPTTSTAPAWSWPAPAGSPSS